MIHAGAGRCYSTQGQPVYGHDWPAMTGITDGTQLRGTLCDCNGFLMERNSNKGLLHERLHHV
eukprot:1157868-Pelagomonas_calceolata.AAC.1